MGQNHPIWAMVIPKTGVGLGREEFRLLSGVRYHIVRILLKISLMLLETDTVLLKLRELA